MFIKSHAERCCNKVHILAEVAKFIIRLKSLKKLILKRSTTVKKTLNYFIRKTCL